MKLNKFYLLLFITGSINFVVSAQSIEEGYYLFPIRPGETNYLSGTMGEIRSNHFHSAIDIKTGGIEGLPVYASADGYVSRIKVSTGGYGNVLYVQHPNSTTTVYAHLLKFNEDIGEYVRQAQYHNKSFEIELFPEKDQLKVEKGKPLGLSGNSGSSGGPHLHFEIRNANQEPLNPLLYGFDEVKDNISPLVREIAVVPLDINSRVNHLFDRAEFKLYRKGNTYYLNEPIEVYGKIGIQILTYDQLNGASNLNGVPCMELKVDGEEVFHQNITRFSFYDTRDILVHYDYENSVASGQRFQKLYIDDGNELDFYQTGSGNGTFVIEDDQEHQVEITLEDAYHNKTEVKFTLKGTVPAEKTSVRNFSRSDFDQKVIDNVLYLQKSLSPSAEKPLMRVYANRMTYSYKPAYEVNGKAVYLWDLKQGIPDSVFLVDEYVNPGILAMVPAGEAFNYYHDVLDVKIPQAALFDTLYLSINYETEGQQEIFTINDGSIPLNRYISVDLKTRNEYENKSKTRVYAINKYGNYSYEGGEWQGQIITFSTRDLGKFTLLADTLAPTIRAGRIDSKVLTFNISDDLSGIKSFDAYVDGEWVLMNYDYKRNLLWSEKLDSDKPFQGQLVLQVIDNVGNQQTFKTTIN
ncbi:MAG: M23 family metallopeptidase [Candidatus Cyclobacteriaceae bacterium M3_2C_046]